MFFFVLDYNNYQFYCLKYYAMKFIAQGLAMLRASVLLIGRETAQPIEIQLH